MDAITRTSTDVYLMDGRAAAIAVTESSDFPGAWFRLVCGEGRRLGMVILLDEDVAPRKTLRENLVWAEPQDLVFANRQISGVSSLPTWGEVTEDLDPLAREVARLHAPVRGVYDRNTTCRGCDVEGHDAESPEWPCRTADMVLESLGLTIEAIEPNSNN